MTKHKTATGNRLYCQWEWLVRGEATNLRDEKLTSQMLRKWSASPEPKLVCIFCGQTYPIDTRGCSRCREYKGLRPYIPEWNDLP